MIEMAAVAVAFVAFAVLAFAASLRLGMLVGVRLDRTVEARASRNGNEVLEASGPLPSSAPHEALNSRTPKAPIEPMAVVNRDLEE